MLLILLVLIVTEKYQLVMGNNRKLCICVWFWLSDDKALVLFGYLHMLFFLKCGSADSVRVHCY